MGLGRTGLLVACLIRDLSDYDGEEAIELTRSYRHGTVETEAQRTFVASGIGPGDAVSNGP
jgi:protein-tyrosine phosphatase